MTRRPHPAPLPHRFAQGRPRVDPPHPQQSPTFPGSPFQPLPAPTGKAPYRLDLAEVVPDAVAAATRAGGIVLHMVGDTGGVQDPDPQTLVARGLEADAGIAGGYGKPCFFYHLGDVIYFDGQAAQYLPQFYEPYAQYDLPMMGIPGNHDGDVLDDGTRTNPLPSLATFVRNFCAAEPGRRSPDAGETSRTAMIQPNVYWTLLTPFATFVGLYTNVPEGGVVQPDQEAWFVEELRAADRDRALIVALHHPIYSLDQYHSGSKPMGALMDRATKAAGRAPDIVFSGHVHNYQRFSVGGVDGRITPFIVAGQGGYHNLHKMAKIGGQPIITPYRSDATTVLEKFCDDRFGFMRLEVSASELSLQTYTVPRPNEAWSGAPQLLDRMRLDWRRGVLL